MDLTSRLRWLLLLFLPMGGAAVSLVDPLLMSYLCPFDVPWGWRRQPILAAIGAAAGMAAALGVVATRRAWTRAARVAGALGILGTLFAPPLAIAAAVGHHVHLEWRGRSRAGALTPFLYVVLGAAAAWPLWMCPCAAPYWSVCTLRMAGDDALGSYVQYGVALGAAFGLLQYYACASALAIDHRLRASGPTDARPL